MIDIDQIRVRQNDVVRSLNRRGKDYARDIALAAELDRERRTLIKSSEELGAKKNALSQQFAQAKRDNDVVKLSAIQAESEELKSNLAAGTERVGALDRQLRSLLLSIPNMPADDVPDGTSETDNKEIYRKGDIAPKPKGFTDHWTYMETKGLADFARAANVSGSRHVFYVGRGAALVRALESFMLDRLGDAGFTELMPPDLVNETALEGTGQLPKFREDLYAAGDKFLSPTGEVQLTNYRAGEILRLEELPLRYCAFSHCFRAEAGSAGRDVKGIIRLHHFRKVEMVKVVAPESSADELETLSDQAEQILSALGLPYRKLLLCAGDTGFSSAKTYDIEVWMPSYNAYKEISSCSNCGDFQARRIPLRFKRDPKAATEYPHTLNGSGVAIDRCVAAIIENFQTEDGRVRVPAVLQGYLGAEYL